MDKLRERSEFINKNVGLVHVCAKRFKSKGIEYEDLFQAGCLGLIKAVDGFDEKHGTKFSTYAVPVILGEIRHLFREGGAIKVGRGIQSLYLNVLKQSQRFCEENGREPSVSELAQILEIEPFQIAQAISASAVPVSLTRGSEEDPNSQIDIPIDAEQEEFTEKLALNQVIKLLEEPDRLLITLRFFKKQTQAQTANILGTTQVQISRREKIILGKLRAKLA